MLESDIYLESKRAQIAEWIAQLAQLDILYRIAGDDVDINADVDFLKFRQHLNDLNAIVSGFQELNEHGRDKFRQIIEESWCELEENFKSSISKYEHLIRAKTNEEEQ